MTDTVLLEQANGIASICLNRPEVHNAFDDALIAQLSELLEQLDQDSSVRCVALRGAGKSFSAGADLNWMQAVASYSEAENKRDALALGGLLHRLYGLQKPSVAIVQGAALGGGVGLVAACDIAVASDQAKFALSEIKLGLIPAVISPFVIAAIGARATKGYALSGERFNADEALRLGLVQQVVPASELDARADALCTTLASYSSNTLAAVKDLIRNVNGQAIDGQLLDATAQRIATQRVSLSGREGISAFLEKRPPNWPDRKS
jgi:methylglutaconyl-CoA hydratase